MTDHIQVSYETDFLDPFQSGFKPVLVAKQLLIVPLDVSLLGQYNPVASLKLLMNFNTIDLALQHLRKNTETVRNLPNKDQCTEVLSSKEIRSVISG